uniref:BAR domain-containing protein n=1 Tax=Anas platyrhynchos TaxID=8839 RepID=A0A8B9TVM1_ANAPL
MPAVDKLLLEEALQDSPQTRSLLSVFEEDAGTLTEYTNQLLQAMQRVYGAQNEMCLATQQLSKQLLAYEKQHFALGKGDEEVISTLHYFSKVVDEVQENHPFCGLKVENPAAQFCQSHFPSQEPAPFLNHLSHLLASPCISFPVVLSTGVELPQCSIVLSSGKY